MAEADNSQTCVRKLMMEVIYRKAVPDRQTRAELATRFIKAKKATEVINELAFILGLTKQDVDDVKKFEQDDLLDKKVYDRLHAIVARMSSLEFMFIPIVLARDKEGFSMTPLLCVRKPTPGCDKAGSRTDSHDEVHEYVDLCKRVYISFPQFLKANKLPPGRLWFPKEGLIQFDENGELLVASHTIEPSTRETWKNVAIVGNIAATVLAITPVAPIATSLLLLASNVPLIGFSIADLVDGCRYERDAVIVARSTALVVSLVTFSSVGLTVVCKVDWMRKMLPVEKRMMLEKTDAFMEVLSKTVAIGNTIQSVVGSLNGWNNLSGADWVEVAANLCVAYRETISQGMAEALFCRLQQHGLKQFFLNFCPNLLLQTIKPKIQQWQANLLDLVVNHLQNALQFTVDDDFTTLRVYGYELKFETLFRIDSKLVPELLAYLRSYVAPIAELCTNWRDPFTNETLVALMSLLRLVSQLKDMSCKLGKYITVGKGEGHQFSFQTLVIWFRLPAEVEKLELLRALTSLNEPQTKQLNELRNNRIKDGDQAFFRWLVGIGHCSSYQYESALNWLLEVDRHTLQRHKFVIEDMKIVINPLLSLSVEEAIALRYACVDTVLQETRFLQLCNDVERQQGAGVQLAERAKSVWLRTCEQVSQQLETISLLTQMFAGSQHQAPASPFTLAEALDYALDVDKATVGSVYYSILFAWSVLLKEGHDVTFDHQVMAARYHQLKSDARDMARSIYLRSNNSLEDEQLIAIARETHTHFKYGPTYTEPPFFGTVERAACFLHLVPALRSKEGRGQFNSTVRYVLKKGDATVLANAVKKEVNDRAPSMQDEALVVNDEAPTDTNARQIMFARGRLKVLIEMKPASNGWNASIMLCSSSVTLPQPSDKSIPNPVKKATKGA